MDTNQETGIVPVTEDNMREYFQRVVDHVASLSTQARKVTDLEQQVHALAQRIGELEANNQALRHDLNTALDRNRQLEAEVSTHREAAVAANEHAVALRDTIVQRDTAVHNLTTLVEEEKAARKIAESDRDDARQRASELEERLQEVQQKLAEMTQDRDHWLDLANTHYNEREAFKEKLDSIQKFLNPVVQFPQQAAS